MKIKQNVRLFDYAEKIVLIDNRQYGIPGCFHHVKYGVDRIDTIYRRPFAEAINDQLMRFSSKVGCGQDSDGLALVQYDDHILYLQQSLCNLCSRVGIKCNILLGYQWLYVHLGILASFTNIMH